MSFGTPQSYVALAVFGATYAALILRNVRRTSLPIWLIFLAGAAAMVLSGSIGLTEAYAAVNLQVIVFLFSMFVLVTALDLSGALEAFAGRILRRAKGPRDVLYLSFFGFAFLSMGLMNDTIALMGTPIMIALARRMKMDAKPLLLTLAFAITIGSAAHPAAAVSSILSSSVVLSQVLSNVPMVALYIPLMKTLGFTSGSAYAWASLAGGSTLAGNLTLLGAASNLIIVQGAEKQGYQIGFFEFLKIGALVTLIDVAVLYAYLMVV